ncbi:ABC transporter ATP-binding protein/permease [Anaerobiospirillum sp. NML120448]|uniref:ABC transporter ATP-binding protein/permease n=1 Tax=Anaerobiospirillum sp. NML120448 TaxID=2932816 RepID=UPI001FF19E62|nr:ABC transporter ATP-binding protein/permease [Anaerobiospirillum sp. NML120448]MCK0514269.1 ABC transporter ATP-binding protein/permease [Anaerobiospirillum sp. NML120448]
MSTTKAENTFSDITANTQGVQNGHRGIDSLPLKVTLKAFFLMLKSYWGCKDSIKSWILLVVIISLTSGSVYIATSINSWYKEFWDTIQNYDIDGFKHQLIIFVILASIHVVVSVYNAYLKSCLAINWRTWLTGKTMTRWLESDNYYKLQLADKNTDNPDQRIAEDLNMFVSSTIVLIIGTATDLAMMISFGVVLWQLSSAVDITVMGMSIHLPDGYMCYLALLYAILGTALTFYLGKPLVKLNFRQQRYEADFRFSLIRVRENSESIALYKGEEEENKYLRQSFSDLVANYIKLIVCTKRLGFLTLGYSQTAVIFPMLISAPLYFAKIITMGSIMQISSAFGRVQDSLSTLVSNFTSWASWKSVVDRLALFYLSMEEVEKLRCIAIEKNATKLEVRDLQIKSPRDKLLLDHVNLDLSSGESLLIRGASGCGKSTLIKALAGIWPYTQGQVRYLNEAKVLFLSQKPYLPQGSLRLAASYPSAPIEDGRTEQFFKLVGLEHLIPHLDEVDTWSHILSLGEQQRVAIVRALLNQPDMLFLDEASSAMDEQSESLVYDLLNQYLPQCIMISVGHRSTLIAKHKLVLTYQNDAKYTIEPSNQDSIKLSL